MTGRQSSAVEAALRSVASGMPIRQAARKHGVAQSSITRARQAAGLPPMPMGRPPKTTLTRFDPILSALLREADVAGDSQQVAICARAMRGNKQALADCARVIAHAAAQRDTS